MCVVCVCVDRSPSTSSPSSVSTIDAKALRQISADLKSPTASAAVDLEPTVDGEETASPGGETETETLATAPGTVTSDDDRKAFVRQRWLNAINKVRDQISQVCCIVSLLTNYYYYYWSIVTITDTICRLFALRPLVISEAYRTDSSSVGSSSNSSNSSGSGKDELNKTKIKK